MCPCTTELVGGISSSLGQSHASAFRRSLAVSSTIISNICLCGHLGVCLRFKPHWMFQIYKYVLKCHEELASCSSLMHSYLFPLLDVLYRQVGNLSFWTVRCTEFRHGGQLSYSGRHEGARNTMPSA